MSILRNRKILVGLAVVVLLALGLRSVVRARTSDSASAVGNRSIFAVRQGPLTISVNVSGTIKPREQEVIKCEVEGQTTILSIVPEGNEVKKGELLIRLDASRLEDAKIDQEIRVQNAEATFIGAREGVEVTKNQTASDVDKAQLALQFAQEDLKNYIDGEFPKLLKEADVRITLTQGTAARTQEKLLGSERLAEKEFITSSELEADKHDALRAQLDLELAEDDKKLLTDFTYKRQLAQLESDVRQARMALERTERRASADVVQAEADFKAKDSEFNRQKSKLAKTAEQIEKTQIFAPADGLVVYATSGQGSWRGNSEPLDEGQVVRERQELIHLPTGSSFKAEVDVHEVFLAKIHTGLPVILKVDALPGQTFQGKVVTIAPLPDAQSAWLNPELKVYDTVIHIEGDVSGLRTGVNCLAEIIVEVHDDVVYVPVQSVVRVGGRPTVYLAQGGKSVTREVELGLDNNRMVHILSGLSAGEQVLLSPPLAGGGEEDEGDEGERTALPAGVEEALSAPKPAAVPGESRPGPEAGAGGRGRAEGGRRGEGGRGGEGRRGEGRGGGLRERYEKATPAEKAEMRKQLEALPAEQRQQIMRQFGGASGGRSRPNQGAQ